MLSPQHKQLPISQTQQNTHQKTLEKQQIVQSKIYVWGAIENQKKIQQSNSKLSLSQRNDQSRTLSCSSFKSTFESFEYLYKFRNNAIVNVNCGKNHIAMISKSGELFMMGSNDQGQLGLDNDEQTTETYFNQPIQISSLYYKGLIIDQVACGFSHTIAVSKNGKVFSWGLGKFGQLGHQNFDSRQRSTEISFFTSAYQSSKEILQIQCGANHCGLLDSQGDLYMWGAGELGQIGSSSRFNENKPFLVRKVTQQNEKIREIALGYYHSLILTDMGRVLQTGISERDLKINQNQNDLSTYFCDVPCLQNSIEILSIKAKEVSAALNSAGQVIIWSNINSYDIIGGIKDIGSFGDTRTIDNIFIHDYEICKDILLLRCDDKFYQYSMIDQSFQNFDKSIENNKYRLAINNLTILSCGHLFIIGVESKRKNISQESKSTNKSQSKRQSLSRDTTGSMQNIKLFQESNEKSKQMPLRGILANKNYALNMGDSDNCSQDMQLYNNKSYQGGQSTVVRKLSSHQHTRSGSRGEALLSMYSNENLQNYINSSQSHSQANLMYRQGGQKNESISQTSQIFNGTQNTNTKDMFNRNIRSIIYDDSNEEEQSNYSLNQTGKQQTLLSYNKNDNNNHFKYNDARSFQNDQEQFNNTGKMLNEQISSIVGPKSLRISYDELRCGPITASGITSRIHVDSSRDNKSRHQSPEDENDQLRHRHQLVSFRNKEDNQQYMRHNPQGSEDFTNLQSKNTLSEKKNGKKEKVKEALNKEIRQRVFLEQQLQSLQQEFDQFRNEVGVDQMKVVLQESQDEYQKLYEICVKECEKSSKYCELYKKEKHLREQRENQIVDLGDQDQMLKNQIRHLEDQLTILRDQKDTEQISLQQTVLDQQKIIEELRTVLKAEKDLSKEKLFDLEELNIQLRQEIQQIHEKNSGQQMLQQQTIQLLSSQNQDLKQANNLLTERLKTIENEKNSIIELLQKENLNLKQELNIALHNIQQKNQTLTQYDDLFSQFSNKEQTLQRLENTIQQTVINPPTLEVDVNNNQNPVIVLSQLQNIQQSTPLFNNQSGQKQERTLSHGKHTNFIVKKNNGFGANGVTKIDNLCKVTAPRILNQTYKNSNMNSNYQSKKSNGNTVKQSFLNQNTRDNKSNQSQNKLIKKPIQRSNENSPQKLQQIIQEQDQNTQKFIKDITKIVGNQITHKDKIQSPQIQTQNVSDFLRSNSQNQILATANTNSSNNMKRLKKSRSNSPIDYLGFKQKPMNQYQPRLSQSNTGSQTTRVQHRQVHINLNQSRNQGMGELGSPKILKTVTDDDYRTPSIYQLNITPVIQSTRGGGNMNASFVGQMTNTKYFDSEFNSQQYLSSGSQQKYNQNLSKSFDGPRSTTNKKKVQFLVENQQNALSLTDQSIKTIPNPQIQDQSQIMQTSFVKNDDSHIIKQENEIEKLYESIASDMKSLKSQNVDNLKGKLEQIRRNKTLLEDKIKEYEKKLGK